VGLRPVVFGPGTLRRTWGTRPVIEVCFQFKHTRLVVD
jgi:hypothetical protein